MRNVTDRDQITVSFCGQTVDDEGVDVEVLFASLSAMGSAFNRANYNLNRDQTTLSISVRATKDGSLDVVIQFLSSALGQEVHTAAGQLLAGQLFTDVKQLVDLVMWLYRITIWSEGTEPETENSQGGNVRLTKSTNGTRVELEVPADAKHLWEDPDIRRDLLGTVAPVGEEIETLKISDSSGETVSVSGDQRGFFVVPEQLLRKEQGTHRCYLNVVAPAFERNHAWRMKEAKKSSDWYYIMDKSFLNRVDSGSVRFGKYDVLECTVETTETQNSDGSSSIRREILEVHDQFIQGQLE